MLKYENKERMIRKKNSESFSFFLRISGTINGFFKVYSFSLMQIGVTIHAHQAKVGYWGLCSNGTKSRNKH